MSLIDDFLAHAADAYPDEACGLVVRSASGDRALRAKNIAISPGIHFDLDPDAWLEVGDDEEVVAVYHSHPNGSGEPSLADLSSCEASKLPWHIVGYPSGHHGYIEPSGFRAPYLERPYVHAIHDCYSLIRDWYVGEEGICLPDFERLDGWWDRGEDLYMRNFAEAGFQEVQGDPQRGDVFLIQRGARVANHGAIYLGDGTILHHVYGRLSCIEPWGGTWARRHVATIRHFSKMGTTNG